MWLFFILISLYSFVTAILRIGGMTPKKFFFIVFLPGLLIMAGLSIVNASLILIHLDKVGIVTSVFSEGGVRKEPIKAGRHWIVPLFEKVLVYPIGIQTYIMSSKLLEGPKIGDDSITARTEDGKEISIECSVTFRIDPDQVITLPKLWQDKYIDIFESNDIHNELIAALHHYCILKDHMLSFEAPEDVIKDLVTHPSSEDLLKTFNATDLR